MYLQVQEWSNTSHNPSYWNSQQSATVEVVQCTSVLQHFLKGPAAEQEPTVPGTIKKQNKETAHNIKSKYLVDHNFLKFLLFVKVFAQIFVMLIYNFYLILHNSLFIYLGFTYTIPKKSKNLH